MKESPCTGCALLSTTHTSPSGVGSTRGTRSLSFAGASHNMTATADAEIPAGRTVRVVAVAGTLAGRSEQPRIVGIDDHIVDLPPSRHMLVVRNDDRPGMIGAVGTTLGRAGINIADMALGRGPTGEHALMVLATDSPVTAEVVEDLRAQPGILDAKSIDLD